MGQKTIGILGGMGPEATAELFVNIIRATPAKRDQDHIRVIIDNNPKVPDRTAAILYGGPSPLPEMTKTAKNLERAGADFIIIPCNTAHYFIDELRGEVKIPILDMIQLTSEWIHERLPSVKRVGLIATTGTVESKIYSHALEKQGLSTLSPTTTAQNRVMEAIYNHIKAGKLQQGKETILPIALELAKEGAEVIICGCTEISLVLKEGDTPVPVADPLKILAEKTVSMALA